MTDEASDRRAARALPELLDALIAEVEIDVTAGAEERSERTRRLVDEIVSRFGPSGRGYDPELGDRLAGGAYDR